MFKKLMVCCIITLVMFYTYGDTATVNGITWTYTVRDGEATIANLYGYKAAISTSTTGNIVVPSKLNGYQVVSIGDFAFYKCSGLTSVTIPSGVTSIGERAFDACSRLTSVTIPDSVTSIGGQAFYGCSGLTSVTIPGSVTTIGRSAFQGCSGIMSVTILDGATSIGVASFYGCSGLTSVRIPSSVTSIGGSAFQNCSGLASVTIPEGVTAIGSYTFYGCSGLTSVRIPSSVTSIGEYAFYKCSGLTSVTIPESVTAVDSYTFYGCSGLTSVRIPSSVTSIGKYSFYRCSGLISVRIPSSITSIGEWAFGNCSGLTSVTIPGSVISIGKYAFQGCSGLMSLTILDGVTSIGYGSFFECSGLMSVTIPSSVTNNNSFITDCYPTNVTVPGHRYGINFSSVTNLVISDGTTNISRYAFAQYRGLTSVTIPGSVISIEEGAFSYCSGLTSLTISDGVTSIGEWAFENCSGLTSVTIPGSVISIGEDAFYYSGLTSVIFKGNAPTVGSDCFYGVDASCVARVSRKTSGWTIDAEGRWNRLILEYVKSEQDLIDELKEFADSKLAEYIKDGNSYAAFLAWATGLKGVSFDQIKTSPNAWFSYALDLPVLIEGEISEERLRVRSFEPMEDNHFTIRFGLDSVDTGDNAEVGNIVRSFAVEGSQSLEDDSFSVTNVAVDPALPEDGAVTFAVAPRVDSDSFFFRTRLLDGKNDIGMNGCSISLDSGNGGVLPNGVSSQIYVPYTEEYGTLPIPTREGYKFLGWFTALEGGEKVDAESKTGFVSSKTLYAHWQINTYTVNFNANGGTGGTTVSRAYGETLGTLPTLTRDGYTFAGWWTAASGGTQVTASTVVTGNVTYYAHWHNVYTVSFNANGGTEGTTVSRTHGEILGTLPTPTRDGYTFAGWWTAASGGTQVTASTVVTGNVTYYAHWQINTYTVNFNANGGTGGTAASRVHGETLGTLPTPTRDGYIFLGWWTELGDGAQVVSTTVVTGSATYYAHWMDCDTHEKVQLWEGGPYWATTNIGAEHPWDSGYGFWWGGVIGYKKDGTDWVASDGSDVKYNWDAPTSNMSMSTLQSEGWITQDNVLALEHDAAYVHWGDKWRMPTTSELVKLECNCDWTWTSTNGVYGYVVRGKGAYASNSIFLPVQDYYLYPPNHSLPHGNGYLGFYYASDPYMDFGQCLCFSSAAINSFGYYHRTSMMCVRPVQVCGTVRFNMNGGSFIEPISIAIGHPLGTLPTPTRDAYTFAGWRTARGEQVTASTIVTESITLYAQWEARSDWDVEKIQLWEGGPYWATMNIGAKKPWDYGLYFWWGDTVGCWRDNNAWLSNDGSNPNSRATYRKSISTLQEEGWITSNSAVEGVLLPEHDAAHINWGEGWRMPTDKEFTSLKNNCDWTWTTTNGVRGYVVCGRGVYASNSIFLPASDYEGFYGTYWSSVSSSSSSHGIQIDTKCLSFDIENSDSRLSFTTLARLSVRPVKDIDSCTITFNVSGGLFVNSISIPVGQSLGALPIPIRSGYAFTGWWTKANGGNEVNASTIVTESITLYAQWEIGRGKVQLWEGGPYWAKENIGAEVPWDYGYCFWWGDTIGYKPAYNKWVASDGSNSNYSFSESDAPTDGKSPPTLLSEGWVTKGGILAPEHDAATIHWGNGWRMPTSQEFYDLNNKCDWTWTSMNGVNGYVVRGRGRYASNSIFLPSYGGDWALLIDVERCGYWSSSPYSTDNWAAIGVSFSSVQIGAGAWASLHRSAPYPVRPVQDVSCVAVTFDTCGGLSVDSISIPLGQSFGDLPIPTREGYAFVGWFTAVGGGTQVTASTIVTGPQILYARWKTHEKVQLWEGGPYWATTNIGAEKPEDYGYYFWWGDTVGYKRENDTWVASDGSNSNFSFISDNTPTFNKSYTTLQSEGWIIADGVLSPEHDAAQAHWGGDWRMPTKQEYSDLQNKCGWTWTTMNGVNGYVVRGRGEYVSNSIFLPCAGYVNGTSLDNAGSRGSYWSSVPRSDYSYDSMGLTFSSVGFSAGGVYDRNYGLSVRPVQGVSCVAVTFDACGGSSVDSISIPLGQSFGDLPIPTREGYAFVGWFTAASGGTQVTANTTASVSMTTLYAQWEKVLSVTLSGALDIENMEVLVGGNVGWFGQKDVSHDALDAAQSGDISDGQTSWMQVVVKDASSVSFWWKVSSETNYDKLHFYVDGTEVVDPISGQRDWIKVEYKLESGSHTLKWSYTKDVSVSNGDDCGWVDSVVLSQSQSQTHEKVQLWEGGPYWATTNIGAENSEDYGYYFWWGDTIGYKRENNKWVASDGSNSNFSFISDNTPTYNKSVATLQSEGWITADGVLMPEHDAAQAHWGGDWRMPTKQEFDDLNSKCDWVWTTVNGVNGYVVRGRGEYASNSIFLPCAGLGNGVSHFSVGSNGYYWSSVPYSGSSSWYLGFGSGSHSASNYALSYGRSVRPLQGFTK